MVLVKLQSFTIHRIEILLETVDNDEGDEDLFEPIPELHKLHLPARRRFASACFQHPRPPHIKYCHPRGVRISHQVVAKQWSTLYSYRSSGYWFVKLLSFQSTLLTILHLSSRQDNLFTSPASLSPCASTSHSSPVFSQ